MRHHTAIAIVALIFLGSCASCVQSTATDDTTDTGESQMGSFTFTADNTTEELTIVGHGLVTGDGPATVRNEDGALPAGLTALDDVWIIRVDNDTVKLATSSANAMLGTAIAFTTDGTGTNYLEIGIPYRRPRTYGVGSQLKSADLNANFDAWKAVHALLTGQTQGIWTDVRLNVSIASLLNLAAGAQLSAGPFVVQGVLSPAALAVGNNNDYNPTGIDEAIMIRLTPAAGAFLTGIAAPSVAGRVLTLINLGADDITVTHEDGSSTAANRIVLPNSTASVVIRDNGVMTLWYDASSARWRVLSQNL